MQTTLARLRTIKQFAREAGVTVRALHLYDRLNLLGPAALSEAGYRLYGEAELERLEQILALRFVGFTLIQIKELLSGSTYPLVSALRLQRQLIARQKRRLESAIEALEQAERALSGDEPVDVWKTLYTVIEVFKVQNDWEWTKKYYSAEALEKLEELRRDMPELIEKSQREWTELLSEVEEAVRNGLDPSSDAAQKLAARWRNLIALFTQGNAAIQEGLNKLWTDPTHWPGDFARPWSDAAEAFIKDAMNRKT